MVLFCLGLALNKFEHYSRPVEAAQNSAAAAFMKVLGTGGEKELSKLQ
jgi:hypothetical protein